MESSTLSQNVSYLESSGFVLSVEQKATLRTSLSILQNQHKFSCVKLWGIVKGIKSDYFIAQGLGQDAMKDRKYLYR